jgi:hypothetical protein
MSHRTAKAERSWTRVNASDLCARETKTYEELLRVLRTRAGSDRGGTGGNNDGGGHDGGETASRSGGCSAVFERETSAATPAVGVRQPRLRKECRNERIARSDLPHPPPAFPRHASPQLSHMLLPSSPTSDHRIFPHPFRLAFPLSPYYHRHLVLGHQPSPYERTASLQLRRPQQDMLTSPRGGSASLPLF